VRNTIWRIKREGFDDATFTCGNGRTLKPGDLINLPRKPPHDAPRNRVITDAGVTWRVIAVEEDPEPLLSGCLILAPVTPSAESPSGQSS
jgi:hypothetical protein